MLGYKFFEILHLIPSKLFFYIGVIASCGMEKACINCLMFVGNPSFLIIDLFTASFGLKLSLVMES